MVNWKKKKSVNANTTIFFSVTMHIMTSTSSLPSESFRQAIQQADTSGDAQLQKALTHLSPRVLSILEALIPILIANNKIQSHEVPKLGEVVHLIFAEVQDMQLPLSPKEQIVLAGQLTKLLVRILVEKEIVPLAEPRRAKFLDTFDRCVDLVLEIYLSIVSHHGLFKRPSRWCWCC